MTSAELKEFISNLQLDLKRLNQLSELLEKQYELMSVRQSQPLETLNQQAMELINQVQQSNNLREQWLSKLGLSADRDGLQTLLAKLPGQLQEGTRQLLQELAIKSRLCHAQNEKSGQLLASQRQLMQKLTGLNTRTSYPGMPL
ncbi:flagellar export chaperone FlgN [Chromatiaceae bacterium AAb-1]|nr:flagellar export chaperone FlgN [Chromatiaceae bacterium AAb-1]